MLASGYGEIPQTADLFGCAGEFFLRERSPAESASAVERGHLGDEGAGRFPSFLDLAGKLMRGDGRRFRHAASFENPKHPIV